MAHPVIPPAGRWGVFYGWRRGPTPAPAQKKQQCFQPFPPLRVLPLSFGPSIGRVYGTRVLACSLRTVRSWLRICLVSARERERYSTPTSVSATGAPVPAASPGPASATSQLPFLTSAPSSPRACRIRSLETNPSRRFSVTLLFKFEMAFACAQTVVTVAFRAGCRAM